MKTSIAPSTIHGVGLFAGEDIPFGALVCLGVQADNDGLKITKEGSVINHSYNPNIRLVKVSGGYALQALSAIHEGEELVGNYDLAPWFIKAANPAWKKSNGNRHNMTDAYLQGFLAKCAEDGIDPTQLLKESARLDHVQQVLQLLFRNNPYERSLEMAKLPLLARGSEASANAASDLKALRQVLGRSKAAPDVARLPAVLQEVSRRR